MSTQIEQKLRFYHSPCISDTELVALFKHSTPHARWSLVKRALAKGDLIQLKRGLYYLGHQLTQQKPSLYELAAKIYWPSYVSLESALSYHGLIPEAVYMTTCVTSKRSKHFDTPLGVFDYHRLPSQPFFTAVERIQENKYVSFMATPWKALCDFVYCRKKTWKNLDPLIHDLRIDLKDLPELTQTLVSILKATYKNSRIERFLDGVYKELKNEY